MTLSARDRKDPNSKGKPDAEASAELRHGDEPEVHAGPRENRGTGVVSEDDTRWISTASALPINGQPVEFVLDARECAITGTYAHGGFLSRWTRYAPELVCKWRGALEDAPRTCRPTPPPPSAAMSP